MTEGDLICVVPWSVNPFRGDKFEVAWRPFAAAALRYGATEWSFWRSIDDRLSFRQQATFANKDEWDRYWYSEEISEARASCAGLFQVPLLPVFYSVKGAGELVPETATS